MPKRLKQGERIIVNIPEYDGAGIYRIENIRTGKAYVGSSINIRQRIKAHDQAMRTGHCNSLFYNDVIQGDKFRVTILEYLKLPTRKDLYERELYYVKRENLFNNGYNAGGVHFNTKPVYLSDGTRRIQRADDILVSMTRKRTKPNK